MAPKKKDESGKRFEELLGELEKVVNALEREEPDLENAIAHYERGVELARLCRARLAEAERRVMILRKNRDGEPEAVPFDEGKGSNF